MLWRLEKAQLPTKRAATLPWTPCSSALRQRRRPRKGSTSTAMDALPLPLPRTLSKGCSTHQDTSAHYTPWPRRFTGVGGCLGNLLILGSFLVGASCGFSACCSKRTSVLVSTLLSTASLVPLRLRRLPPRIFLRSPNALSTACCLLAGLSSSFDFVSHCVALESSLHTLVCERTI